MAARHHDLDALARDLADLVGRGVPPDDPAIAEAHDALQAARSAVAQDSAPAAEEAVAAARAALEQARDLIDGTDESHPAPARRSQVQLDSEIPDDHPDKSAIETAVAGAFAGVRGRWRVAILVQDKASWWGLRVEGSSISWTGTLDGPEEQSPDFLAGRVREAVQLGLMQSALGRGRGHS